jgi:hypothetical protein
MLIVAVFTLLSGKLFKATTVADHQVIVFQAIEPK